MNHSMMAILAVLVLTAGATRAGQADPFEMGVKAGVSVATLTKSSVKDPDSVTGLTGGLAMSIGMGPVALAPELLFTAKGFKTSAAIGTTALTVVNHYNYIDLPVLLKLVLIPVGPVRPYLSAGPSVSYLMTAKSKTTLAGATTTADVKSAFKTYDFAAVGDVGLAVFVGFSTLSVDLRYALGLVNTSTVVGVNTKNSVISVLAGLTF